MHAESSQPVFAPHATGDEIDIVRWATDHGANLEQMLGVNLAPRPSAIPGSPATGQSMVSNGSLGADLVRLAAGDGFEPHTHPGDHLLIVLGGRGTITYRGKVRPTAAGEMYLIAGLEPHAVGAITDHVILAVGSPHRPVDAPDRMTILEYEAITTDICDLHCLICDVQERLPRRLHDAGCPHCPCSDCHPQQANRNVDPITSHGRKDQK